MSQKIKNRWHNLQIFRLFQKLISTLNLFEKKQYTLFLLGHNILLAARTALRSIVVNLGILSFLASNQKWILSNTYFMMYWGFYISFLYGIIIFLLFIFDPGFLTVKILQKNLQSKVIKRYKNIPCLQIWLKIPLYYILILAELIITIILGVFFYIHSIAQQLSV